MLLQAGSYLCWEAFVQTVNNDDDDDGDEDDDDGDDDDYDDDYFDDDDNHVNIVRYLSWEVLVQPIDISAELWVPRYHQGCRVALLVKPGKGTRTGSSLPLVATFRLSLLDEDLFLIPYYSDRLNKSLVQ